MFLQFWEISRQKEHWTVSKDIALVTICILFNFIHDLRLFIVFCLLMFIFNQCPDEGNLIDLSSASKPHSQLERTAPPSHEPISHAVCSLSNQMAGLSKYWYFALLPDISPKHSMSYLYETMFSQAQMWKKILRNNTPPQGSL